MSIFHNFYDFICLLSVQINKFPKKDRYSLGGKIFETSLNFLILVIKSNAEKNFKRSEMLKEASVLLDILKILLRLAKDTKALPEKQYVLLQEKLQTTGKMLGGWIKSSKE